MSIPKVMLLACGSYSPPTNMHLRMFEIARDYFNQMGTHNVVGGIISPVHDSYGKQELVAAKHRAAMVKLAVQSSEWIRLSDWEIQQEEWTRTRLTLQHHQNYINSLLNDSNGTINEMLPGWVPENIKSSSGSGTVQVKLLCGADLLESFATPGLWAAEDIEAIVGHHGIVVVSRAGTNPDQFIFNSDILSKYRRNIHIVTNFVSNEISSTVVRKLMRRRQSVKYLIDDYIIAYCKQNNLFGINDSKYILTPNNNQLLLSVPPPPFPGPTDDVSFENMKNHQRDVDEDDDNEEDMDETDYSLTQNFLMRPKILCCGGGDGLSVKSFLNRNGTGNIVGPGQAVQIITDAEGTHHLSTSRGGGREHKDQVGDDDDAFENLPPPAPNRTRICEVQGCENEVEENFKETMSDDEYIGGGSLNGTPNRKGKLSLPSTSSRHNDIIKFVFTDHGIRVISDKEYVV